MAVEPRRSLLFVPGAQRERFPKALASGADIVCVDLEDAVIPTDRPAARGPAFAFLDGSPGPQRVVRVNAVRSADGLRDLLALVEARPPAGTIMLPKVETAAEIGIVDAVLSEAGLDLSIAVLVETIAGVEAAPELMRASSRNTFVLFGGVDLAAELGVSVEEKPLAYARARVVHAAKGAGLDVLDVPCLAFRDEAVVATEAAAARALGFTGKAVLHPANVAAVNAVFTPSDEEVARAERYVAAYKASPNGLAVIDGKLVEKPVIRAMERILAAAGRSAT
jgi:citrate lyase subunit beta/citryl-CoA lyase/(S)-citramalyl-CoA lyase